jgi:hypothetical protein
LKGFVAARCLSRKLEREQQEAKDHQLWQPCLYRLG